MNNANEDPKAREIRLNAEAKSFIKGQNIPDPLPARAVVMFVNHNCIHCQRFARDVGFAEQTRDGLPIIYVDYPLSQQEMLNDTFNGLEFPNRISPQQVQEINKQLAGFPNAFELQNGKFTKITTASVIKNAQKVRLDLSGLSDDVIKAARDALEIRDPNVGAGNPPHKVADIGGAKGFSIG